MLVPALAVFVVLQLTLTRDVTCGVGVLHGGVPITHAHTRTHTHHNTDGRLENAHEAVDLPVLVTQGGLDTYVRPADTASLFERAPSDNKTLIHITNMNHGLLHEPGCETLFVHNVRWVEALVSRTPSRGDSSADGPVRVVRTIQAEQGGASAGEGVGRATGVPGRVGSSLSLSWTRSSRGVLGATTAPSASSRNQHVHPRSQHGVPSTMAHVAPSGSE